MASLKIADIDRRCTPRITANPPIGISGDMGAQLVNVNDGGICFSTEKSLALKTCYLTIDFPSEPVKIHIQIKWGKKSENNNEFLYGASLIDTDNKTLTIIRKYMISKQFKFVIKDIKNRLTRKHVLGFAKVFRDYLFKLIDLSVLLSERRIEKEELQKKITILNNNIVTKGEKLREDINNKLIFNKIKHEFRLLVSCWAYKSQIMKRGFDKPRGYPGDYETLEVIYDKKTFSPETELGYYFDGYFLDNPYAEAVRNRKDTLRGILLDLLKHKKDDTKVLNLACGSCRELVELYKYDKDVLLGKSVTFSCLDWDEHALNFSKESLKNLPSNVKMNFIKEDVMKFVRGTEYFETNGEQDLIYSIGLADYLPDRILKNMIKNSFKGLKKNGNFIIAHKDKEIAFSHLPPEWFCDWVFISRNERDMLKIVNDAGLENFSYDIKREISGQIFFITITKH
ncbi:MAG: class I SAM-dependent methyltransferase [Candidatus Omnitrophica bacterium]|nr:class I SAM-dependent methyltransferase [Candidatus Omnitrophota bacterium]